MRIFSDIDNDGSADPAGVRELIRTNLVGVGAIIALASARGGVGKSMLAVNVAAALAMKGRKVAIVDADLNSPSITAMLGMKPRRRYPMIEGIEPAAAPHGLRVVSSDQLPGGEAPPMSFVQDYDQRRRQRRRADRARAGTSRGIELSRCVEPHPLAIAVRRRGFADHRSRERPRSIVHAGFDGGARRRAAPQSSVLARCARCAPGDEDWTRARRAHRRPRREHGRLQLRRMPLRAAAVAGRRSQRSRARECGADLGRLAFEPRLADSTDRGVLFVREYASTPTGKVLADIASHVDAIVAARTRAVATPAT